MDHGTLSILRERNPAWRLLASSHAPLIASFLHRVFVAPNVRTMSESVPTRDGLTGRVRHMSRIALIALLVCVVIVASAADPSKKGPTQAPSATTKQLPDEELEEVLVEGRRPVTEPRKLVAWIDRLVGRFRYEGYVERHSPDGTVDRAEVHGGSQCVRFGKAVAVQCLVNVTWGGKADAVGKDPTGDASPLAPAVVVYGLSSAKKYFGHLQVDNNGVATGGKGWLVDDTLISRDPCADFPDCLRVIRLEAPPDARVIRMRVDLERNGKLQLRHDFRWNRLPASQAAQAAAAATIISTESSPGPRTVGAVKVPPDIEEWLRRLPGQFRIPAVDESSCWRMQSELAARSDAGAAQRLDCPRSVDEKAAAKGRPADAECQSIGTGPGVRCVMYMAWPESGIPVSRKWYQTLNSTFLMYGFDPVKRGIGLVLVGPTSDVGPAGFMAGLLKDGKLNYISDCSRPPCTAIEQMTVAPGGEWVKWQISRGPGMPELLSWRMDRLRKQEVSGAAEAAPKSKRSITSPRRQ